MKRKTYPMKPTEYTVQYGGQPFAKSVVVDNLVFCSGKSGKLMDTGLVRSDDPAVQTKDALDMIKNMLEEAGSSLDNIVKVTMYVKDIPRDRDKVYNVWLDYMRKNTSLGDEGMPALTLVGVAALAWPEMLVEIDVTAIIPG